MRIAVQGCCHGELNRIYAEVSRMTPLPDLLIICGDFQGIRHAEDLRTMACPPKYRRMGDFADYYLGKKRAPLLTLFIGGNHEASAYLRDLWHGGWVAPQIYYLGHAGVVRIGGLRIAGISGLYNPLHYHLGRYESGSLADEGNLKNPRNNSHQRSVYHYREMDTFKLSLLRQPIDIFVSHEWPRGIYNFGNKEALLQAKPFFRTEVTQGRLGAAPLEVLLHRLKPRYWFSAHLHVRFEATVVHGQAGQTTEFLALDKCLGRRKFLELVNVPELTGDSTRILQYDPEWLSIVKATDPLYSTQPSPVFLPKEGSEERQRLLQKIQDDQKSIPELPEFNADNYSIVNPQTAKFCQMLGIAADKLVAANKNDGNPEEISLE